MNLLVESPPIFKVVLTGVNTYRVELAQTILQGPVGPQGLPGADGAGGAASTKAYEVLIASRLMVLADAAKFLHLDGSATAVNLTINPATVALYLFPIRCDDNTNACTIEATTGIIERGDGGNPTILELDSRQTIWVYSNGTNLEIL